MINNNVKVFLLVGLINARNVHWKGGNGNWRDNNWDPGLFNY